MVLDPKRFSKKKKGKERRGWPLPGQRVVMVVVDGSHIYGVFRLNASREGRIREEIRSHK
jgi:hypothetical protein